MQFIKSVCLLIMDSKPMKSAYSLFLRYLFRSKKIYFVSGMRRSGNHAFIEWLVNSIEGKETELKNCNQFRYFNATPSKNTIFLNEVNEINTLVYFRMILKHKSSIKKCKNLVISVEDCSADYSSYKIPRYDEAIFVKRSFLNLVASRVKYLVKRAEGGRSNYWNAIDTDVLEKILTFENSEKYKIWEYEKWLSSNEYRQSFLNDLGLQHSYIPQISRWGGGSSFSGVEEKPDQQDLTERYLQIDFSERIISQFQNERYRELLTAKERKFLEQSYHL